MNSRTGLSRLLPFMALSILLFALYGCASTSDSSYVVDTSASGEIEEVGGFSPEDSTTIIGGIVKEWRAFSVIFLMISIGLIALAYPLSTALDMPSLKAWADIELGEAFSTAFVVMFILGILVFVEILTQSIVVGLPGISCSGPAFCPVQVAEQYIGQYLDSSIAIYGDLFENAATAGKLGTMSTILGTNWMWLLYLSISAKITPHFMIEVTTAGQEMQFLMGMRDALIFQQFILRHVSATLAPMALMLGIVMRTFFATRKLGGLLMAFGIGFLLAFPLSYALAMFTLHNTIYGASVTGGDVTNEFCTQSCLQLPPMAYDNFGERYTSSELREAFPQGTMEDEEYTEMIYDFIAGEHCELIELPDGSPGEECTPVTATMHSDVTGTDIITCGQYGDICPQQCRAMPYPNYNVECASSMTEYQCRENVPEECFVVRYANMDDPVLGGLEEGDAPGGDDDTCPEKCRPLNALQKEGCDVGYGFVLWPEIETVSDADEVLEADGYLDNYMGEGGTSIRKKCKGCDGDSGIKHVLKKLKFKDVEENVTVIWEEGCPNYCRWISTTGRMNPGCDELCEGVPGAEEALEAWEAAAAEDEEGQKAIAQEQCYMIIPDEVFTSQDCLSCDYLIDPGFGSYPPLHHRCDKLCGGMKNVAAQKDSSSMKASTEGFEGPAEMKEITKLTVPAVVLPMLNIVITFIFIRALSPVLGGDIDIPGMMRMIK